MWYRYLISLGQMSAAARTSRSYAASHRHQLLSFSPPPPYIEEEFAEPLTDRHGGCGLEDFQMTKVQ